MALLVALFVYLGFFFALVTSVLVEVVVAFGARVTGRPCVLYAPHELFLLVWSMYWQDMYDNVEGPEDLAVVRWFPPRPADYYPPEK